MHIPDRLLASDIKHDSIVVHPDKFLSKGDALQHATVLNRQTVHPS